ncbi:MAG: RDD family protein [Thermoanaerobaculales bacterium]|nr:RDD family protein [Thermoanaerobaculales bacterium]
MPELFYREPDTAGEMKVDLGENEITIGRSVANTVVVVDKAVSRQHAVIRKTPKGFVLVDNSSANGTFVNDVRVSDRTLEHGDVIRIGSLVLRYDNPPDPEATMLLDVAEAFGKAKEEADRNHAEGVETPPVGALRHPAAPPIPPVAPMAPPVQPPPLPVAAGGVEYAGFRMRLFAYVLDGLVLGFALSVIQVPLALIAGALAPKQAVLAVIITILGWLIITLAGILYVLYFWATRGATPAKKLLGMKIVRQDGVEPMGWGKAGLRLLGYIASGFILCMGFLMVLFTERSRSLHDMIAGTVVIKTRS